MKAAVVTSFTAPIGIEQREVPTPGPGQVLVRLEACGLCHTDIHAAHGDWPVKPTVPFVPGHEGVGIVAHRAAPAESHRLQFAHPAEHGMGPGQVPADDFGELRRELVVVRRAARQPGDKAPQGSLGARSRHRTVFSRRARRLGIRRL